MSSLCHLLISGGGKRLFGMWSLPAAGRPESFANAVPASAGTPAGTLYAGSLGRSQLLRADS